MKAEVLAIGTELLMGQITNTNAQYISRRLADVGIGVYYQSVVGDNPQRLKEVLSLALGRVDLLLMTGGLGPTQDDLTKETAARLLGRKLVLHSESLRRIEEYFKRINRPLTPNNVKQAYLPEGCIVINNNNGTAPGCIIEEGGRIVVMLPGPPSEMIPMFEDTVIPYLEAKTGCTLVSRYLKIFRIGESLLEQKIIDLVENQSNPTIAPYAKEGEVSLRITARGSSRQEAEKLIEPVVQAIRERIGDALYSTDGTELHELAARLLMERGASISLAESCTGGLITARLTDVPGISAVLDRGLVTYSNRAKEELLGVKRQTLEKYGAVSSQTAIEMAEGVRKLSGTHLGVSATGIAGPGGATPEKPVGLVYVALSDGKTNRCRELKLRGSRERIRNVTALHAFDMIRRYLLNIPDN